SDRRFREGKDARRAPALYNAQPTEAPASRLSAHPRNEPQSHHEACATRHPDDGTEYRPVAGAAGFPPAPHGGGVRRAPLRHAARPIRETSRRVTMKLVRHAILTTGLLIGLLLGPRAFPQTLTAEESVERYIDTLLTRVEEIKPLYASDRQAYFEAVEEALVE